MLYVAKVATLWIFFYKIYVPPFKNGGACHYVYPLKMDGHLLNLFYLLSFSKLIATWDGRVI